MGAAMSLKAACRYTLTQIRARSYFMPAFGFIFAYNALDFSKRVFYPALSRYALIYDIKNKGLMPDTPLTSPVLRTPENVFRSTWRAITSLPIFDQCLARENLIHKVRPSLETALDPSIWRYLSYGLIDYP